MEEAPLFDFCLSTTSSVGREDFFVHSPYSFLNIFTTK